MLRGHADVSGEDAARQAPSGRGGCGVGGGDGGPAAESVVSAVPAVEGGGNAGVQIGVLANHPFRTSAHFEGLAPDPRPLSLTLDLCCVCPTVSRS